MKGCRPGLRPSLTAVWLLTAGVVGGGRALGAQDSLPAPGAGQPAVAAADSIPAPVTAGVDSAGPRRPVSPLGAMWRSMLVPGWGQARLNRKLTGALFITWEGVTLGMSLKTSRELAYLRRTGSGSVGAKEKERQDWLVLLVFNHLFSGLEAYVSAHLWDFPEDLEVSAGPIPGGGVGAVVRLPVRLP